MDGFRFFSLERVSKLGQSLLPTYLQLYTIDRPKERHQRIGVSGGMRLEQKLQRWMSIRELQYVMNHEGCERAPQLLLWNEWSLHLHPHPPPSRRECPQQRYYCFIILARVIDRSVRQVCFLFRPFFYWSEVNEWMSYPRMCWSMSPLMYNRASKLRIFLTTWYPHKVCKHRASLCSVGSGSVFLYPAHERHQNISIKMYWNRFLECVEWDTYPTMLLLPSFLLNLVSPSLSWMSIEFFPSFVMNYHTSYRTEYFCLSKSLKCLSTLHHYCHTNASIIILSLLYVIRAERPPSSRVCPFSFRMSSVHLEFLLWKSSVPGTNGNVTLPSSTIPPK